MIKKSSEMYQMGFFLQKQSLPMWYSSVETLLTLQILQNINGEMLHNPSTLKVEKLVWVQTTVIYFYGLRANVHGVSFVVSESSMPPPFAVQWKFPLKDVRTGQTAWIKTLSEHDLSNNAWSYNSKNVQKKKRKT